MQQATPIEPLWRPCLPSLASSSCATGPTATALRTCRTRRQCNSASDHAGVRPTECSRDRITGMNQHLALAFQALTTWRTRQWFTVLVVAGAAALLLGFVTVLIPNEIFRRDIPPVPWNYPVWIATAVLSGMLAATYVSNPKSFHPPSDPGETTLPATGTKKPSRAGIIGAFASWFAIGCPVCNKLALLAFGYSGALTYFAPFQPWLAAVAMLLSAGALIYRLSGQMACPTKAAPSPQ